MKVIDVLEFLNNKYPLDLAEAYDNCGLIIGNENDEVTSGIVALDCTKAAVDEAISRGANLIITHHPLMFSAIKQLHSGDLEFELIRHGINLISMHTNLDAADGGVNDVLCEKLGLTGIEKLVCNDFAIRIGKVTPAISPEEFASRVSNALSCPVKFVAGKNDISRVAVCSGSGGEFLDCAIAAGADAFLSSEIKHHQFMHAANLGFSLFDAGHQTTEDIIVEELTRVLNSKFGGFEAFNYNPIQYT